MRGVWIADVAGTRLLALDVETPERFATLGGWRQRVTVWLSRLNRATGLPSVSISFQELTPSLGEAWLYIERITEPRPTREDA